MLRKEAGALPRHLMTGWPLPLNASTHPDTKLDFDVIYAATICFTRRSGVERPGS
ncbi:hypothetical protein [Ensifer aridi]|uniref:hypothetical protein n=1 Tax=Ensifer aridi TaxID=1708715 RepID=UPI001553F314|nr:hypothetical protein [Ensifer aridi]